MNKGEIWLADLNPKVGSEQSGVRPVVIISGNVMNDNFNLIITCPITSKVKNFIGGVVLQPNDTNGLSVKSEILTFHVRTISKERLTKKLGSITDQENELLMENLNKILRY